MKRLIHQLFGGIIAAVILIMATGTAWGEPLEGELMVLPQQANIIVSISYETEVPDITLISPDGTTYSENTGNVNVQHGDRAIYYYLPDALAGQWLLQYDKKSNPTITADYAEYTPDLWIESLTLQGISGRQAEVLFKVSYEGDISYEYVVSAVLLDEDGHVTGRKELERGRARSNSEESKTISLDKLSSYDKYHLELEAYYKAYNLETSDIKIADQNFVYASDNQPEALAGMKVEIEPDNQILVMDWTDYKVYCDSYMVAIFTKENQGEPVSYQTTEDAVTSAQFILPADAHSITVEISYVKQGVVSRAYRRQIDWENEMKLSIDTEENTNSVQALVTYDTSVTRHAVVSVNGEEQQVVLEGRGNFSVQLQEYTNDFSIKCALDDMTDMIYRKSVYSDRIAPILKFYETVDGVTVADNHFLLMGETENGCILTINDSEYPLDANGSFSADLPLGKGENVYDVISCDPAGNQSLHKITIYHGDVPAGISASTEGTYAKGANYLPLMITLAGGMAVVLTVMITGLFFRKRTTLSPSTVFITTLINVFLLLSAFGTTASFLTGFLMIKASQSSKSMEFIQAAQHSPMDAYILLQECENSKKLFIVVLAGTMMLLIVTVVMALIKRKINRKRNNNTEVVLETDIKMGDETEEIEYCMHCGEKMNRIGAAFCPHCGEQVIQEDAPS